jgi:hypothetical protein
MNLSLFDLSLTILYSYINDDVYNIAILISRRKRYFQFVGNKTVVFK